MQKSLSGKTCRLTPFVQKAFSATADNASPYSGSVRNSFIGVYVEVPEPSACALMGLAGLLATFVIRRRR